MALLAFSGGVGAAPSRASDVRFFRANERATVALGEAKGVGVDSLGTVRLTDAIEQVAEIEEPFAFNAAVHPKGWVVGTGNEGRVQLIGVDGAVTTLFDTEEPEVFAVHVDSQGVVYAGTSPNGKVYRMKPGADVEVFFDPEETYIWAIESHRDQLIVATGTEGKVYKVGPGGQAEVLVSANDTHARSLAVQPDGSVLVGTAPDGLILHAKANGEIRTLYDSGLPEVVALACAEDGRCFAALLDSEASLVSSPAPADSGESTEDAANGDGARVTVKMEEESDSSKGARLRAAVVRVDLLGGVDWLTTFESETVYDLVWRDERLWIATGQEGKLFTLEGSRLTLERQVEASQIVGLLDGPDGFSFVTTNGGGVYRSSDSGERAGTYTSPALDAEEVSEFGVFSWQGSHPSGSGLRFLFRSGMSSTPDVTWSDWTDPQSGAELGLSDLPPARFVQWRAELSSKSSASPEIRETTLSFRQRNQAPKINRFEALSPGVVLVQGNFNASQQVYEPVHPNREGIFTSLRPGGERDERRTKRVWKKGLRTLRWEAKDPNGDPLSYDLSFQPDDGALSEDGWMVMESDLSEDSFSFDESALPDGVYRFRLRASDAERNLAEAALEALELSPPVLVDQTPPRLASVKRSGDTLEFKVVDETSQVLLAEVSIDGGAWSPARALDGMTDAQEEVLEVALEADARFVLLRLGDSAWNHVTYNLLEELQKR